MNQGANYLGRVWSLFFGRKHNAAASLLQASSLPNNSVLFSREALFLKSVPSCFFEDQADRAPPNRHQDLFQVRVASSSLAYLTNSKLGSIKITVNSVNGSNLNPRFHLLVSGVGALSTFPHSDTRDSSTCAQRFPISGSSLLLRLLRVFVELLSFRASRSRQFCLCQSSVFSYSGVLNAHRLKQELVGAGAAGSSLFTFGSCWTGSSSICPPEWLQGSSGPWRFTCSCNSKASFRSFHRLFRQMSRSLARALGFSLEGSGRSPEAGAG
ncbi:Hypothetical_protein [Hexamita inflata]|uniref:Hypothetical_protein n=1 Tax=Hexamita inflata TaxID=28002 RepID=A0AA86P1G7_9EUKA|nr:Hypothetical protein HINF_LOCUS17794 [Hexamita inflata]